MFASKHLIWVTSHGILSRQAVWFESSEWQKKRFGTLCKVYAMGWNIQNVEINAYQWKSKKGIFNETAILYVISSFLLFQ